MERKSLLEQMKRTALRTGEAAMDAACAVGSGALRLADSADRRLRIADLRAEIHLRLRELGELLYATHTGNPTDSDVLLAKMQEIDALKAQLRKLGGEQEIILHVICPACGCEVEPDDVFCKTCGEKL